MPAVTFPDLSINAPLWLSLAATAAGALQGALLGIRKGAGLDVFGMLVLAVCLGFGGGIIRDVLVGDLPPVALRTPWYTLTVMACTVMVIAFGRLVASYSSVLVVLDAATLGLFASIGCQAAIDTGLPDLSAMLIGTVASVGGGMAASLLQQETPMVMRPGPPYALAALGGATVYVLVDEVNVGLASFACIAVVFVVRIWTWRSGVTTKALALPDA